MRGRERIEIAGKFAADPTGGALDLVHGASATVRQAGAEFEIAFLQRTLVE